MRIKDVYYTSRKLDGAYTPPGKQPALEFPQGTDFQFDVYLNLDGQPVDMTKFDIRANVKTDQNSVVTRWEASVGNGIYTNEAVGHYTLIVPKDISKDWRQGIYWLNILCSHKPDSEVVYRDMTYNIVEQPFTIYYTAASPMNETLEVGLPPVETTSPKSVPILINREEWDKYRN